ncbi:hypothetical protein HWV62_36763 [Athelia sp. TMB]|nr:hypothetical protein HWV62_36763 [Athelia sp. TMB]
MANVVGLAFLYVTYVQDGPYYQSAAKLYIKVPEKAISSLPPQANPPNSPQREMIWKKIGPKFNTSVA